MEKFLLTGGFAAIILLGACSTPEEAVETVQEEITEDEEVEAETVEESTEEVTEESTEVESTKESAKSTGEQKSLAEANSELAGQEGITEIYGMNDEVVLEKIDSLNVTRDGMVIAGLEITPDIEWYFSDEGYSVGDEIQVAFAFFTVENTVEEARSFYLDQTTIITSDGQQVESELLLSNGPESEMLGAVKTSGHVMFILEDGSADNIEWIDIMIPRVSDGNFNTLTDEYKQRVEINKE